VTQHNTGLQILEEHIVRDVIQQIARLSLTTSGNGSTIVIHSPESFGCLHLQVPGAEKTTIAGTLYERLKAAGRLGGDYFFSRNARKDAKPLIPIISHYLATTFPSAREAVERLFAKYPDVLHRTTDIQLQRLIIEPLLALNPDSKVPGHRH